MSRRLEQCIHTKSGETASAVPPTQSLAQSRCSMKSHVITYVQRLEGYVPMWEVVKGRVRETGGGKQRKAEGRSTKWLLSSEAQGTDRAKLTTVYPGARNAFLISKQGSWSYTWSTYGCIPSSKGFWLTKGRQRAEASHWEIWPRCRCSNELCLPLSVCMWEGVGVKQEGQIPKPSREYLVLQKIHSSQNQKTRSHTKNVGKARTLVVWSPSLLWDVHFQDILF